MCKTQDTRIEPIDTYEKALTSLNESVAGNREDIRDNSRKLDAIIEHLQVPYEKPPMGFQEGLSGAMCKMQDTRMEPIDTYEEALTGLNESVATNHETSQRQFAELNRKLDAIIKAQNVPYEPMGFMKED